VTFISYTPRSEFLVSLHLSIRFLCLLVMFSLPDAPVLGNCHCNPPKKDETTHWVGNQVVVFVEKDAHRGLHGVIVSQNGKPLAGALVEVFTEPDYLLSEKTYDRGNPGQRRVVACRTGLDGKFCFSNLASGKYEVRSSSEDTSTGWNTTQVYVVVDRDKGTGKRLRIEMILGT